MAKKKRKANNYFKLGLILISVALFTLIAANIYKNILRNNINSSYLTKYVSSIKYNEIKNAKLEFSGDTFLYVSYSGDKDVHNLDVKLKKLIVDNDLKDDVIYLDMKDYLNKSDYLNELNTTLELTSKKVVALPAILYYQDDKLIEIIDSTDHLLNSGDFTQLIEKYEIGKNGEA